jgi:hypothetical protein
MGKKMVLFYCNGANLIVLDKFEINFKYIYK